MEVVPTVAIIKEEGLGDYDHIPTDHQIAYTSTFPSPSPSPPYSPLLFVTLMTILLIALIFLAIIIA